MSQAWEEHKSLKTLDWFFLGEGVWWMIYDTGEILLQSSVGDQCEHLFSDVVHPAFPLPTTALPTLGAPKDGFGEAARVHDMPESWPIIILLP